MHAYRVFRLSDLKAHGSRLEHDLRRALSVFLGVKKRLFRRNPELRVSTVLTDHVHVVPIRVGRRSRGMTAVAVDRWGQLMRRFFTPLSLKNTQKKKDTI